MEINPIKLDPGLNMKLSPMQGFEEIKNENISNFKDLLKSALDKVSSMQSKADDAVISLASGEPIDIHDVMVNMEQANIAMQLTMQIRNKLVDAYQEILRMQI